VPGVHRPDFASFTIRPVKESGLGIAAFDVTPVAARTSKCAFDFRFELERYVLRSPVALVADGPHHGPTAKAGRMLRKNRNKLFQDGGLKICSLWGLPSFWRFPDWT
jgi:hypothetical protein